MIPPQGNNPGIFPDFRLLIGKQILFATIDDVIEVGERPHLFPRPGVVSSATKDSICIDCEIKLTRTDLISIDVT